MTYEVELVDLRPQTAAVVRGHVAVAEIPAFLGRAFGQVMEALSAQGLAPAGPPFARYTQMGDQAFDMEAGFPAIGQIRDAGDVVVTELPGGPGPGCCTAGTTPGWLPPTTRRRAGSRSTGTS